MYTFTTLRRKLYSLTNLHDW